MTHGFFVCHLLYLDTGSSASTMALEDRVIEDTGRLAQCLGFNAIDSHLGSSGAGWKIKISRNDLFSKRKITF